METDDLLDMLCRAMRYDAEKAAEDGDNEFRDYQLGNHDIDYGWSCLYCGAGGDDNTLPGSDTGHEPDCDGVRIWAFLMDRFPSQHGRTTDNIAVSDEGEGGADRIYTFRVNAAGEPVIVRLYGHTITDPVEREQLFSAYRNEPVPAPGDVRHLSLRTSGAT